MVARGPDNMIPVKVTPSVSKPKKEVVPISLEYLEKKINQAIESAPSNYLEVKLTLKDVERPTNSTEELLSRNYRKAGWKSFETNYQHARYEYDSKLWGKELNITLTRYTEGEKNDIKQRYEDLFGLPNTEKPQA